MFCVFLNRLIAPLALISYTFNVRIYFTKDHSLEAMKMGQFSIENFIKENYKPTDFSHLHWNGNFQDYIDVVTENPHVTRNAFQRIYDMIMTLSLIHI